LIGKEALAKLKGARVAVFGLGAVGSYAVEALARAGIGFLRLVDCDVVRPSNINRQIFALESTLNRPKAEVAAERVLDINPACKVEAMHEFAGKSTISKLLEKPLDAVIDAIDSVSPKVELIAAAVHSGIQVVSSMGAATRMDPAAVRLGDISETDVCPLARYVRKRLRRRGITTGFRCVFSIEDPFNEAPCGKPQGISGASQAEFRRSLGQPAFAQLSYGEVRPAIHSRGIHLRTDSARLEPRSILAKANKTEAVEEDDQSFRQGRLRRPIGSFSYMTGIFGLLAAYEVIKIIIPVQRKAHGRKESK